MKYLPMFEGKEIIWIYLEKRTTQCLREQKINSDKNVASLNKEKVIEKEMETLTIDRIRKKSSSCLPSLEWRHKI